MPIVSISKGQGIASALVAGAIMLALSILTGCSNGYAIQAAPTAVAPTAAPSAAVTAMATATAAPSATATAKATATAAPFATVTATAIATALSAAPSTAGAAATVVPAAGSDGAIVWIADMQCSGCHPAEVASMTDGRLTVNAHVKAGVDQCTSCHDLSDLETDHKGVNTAGKPAAKPKYSNDFCLKCHGTYADLAKRTAGSTAFQIPDGKYINPHLPPTATHASDVACWNCHEFHGLQTPLDYCYTCHMKQVLECNTCHGQGGMKE